MSQTLISASQRLNSAINPLIKISNGIAVVLLGFMPIPVFLDVIFRLVVDASIPGGIELEEMVMAMAIFFSLAYSHVHGGHIDIDVLTLKLPARTNAVIQTCMMLAASIFLALMTWHLLDQGMQKMVNRQLSFTYHLPVGILRFIAAVGTALMSLATFSSFLKDMEKSLTARDGKWVVLGMAVLALFAVAPLVGWISMDWGGGTIGIMGMCVLFLFLFLGMPIGLGMGVTGFLGMIVAYNRLWPSLSMLGMSSYDTAGSYMMTVVPMFILMGEFAYRSGISQDLFDTANKWLSRLPGGLAISAVAGCAGFAAICGDSLATAVTMSSAALPEMRKHKYDPSLALGSLAAGGTLGILIPPSVGFIFYGIVTEESIGKLFVAGILPGILLALLFIFAIYIKAKRNPELAPAGEHFSWAEKIKSLKGVIGMLFLFLLILGGMLGGIFSAVEGAAVGAVGAFILAVIRKRLTFDLMIKAVKDTLAITNKLLLILIGVGILGYFLAATRLPFVLAQFITGLEVNRYVVFAAVILFYMILGCVLNVIPMILLVLPTLFPSITALGFDPIWFGVVTVITMEMGQITPPVGVNVFAMAGIATDVPMYTIFRGIFPFFLCMCLCILILTFFPGLATFLPSVLF
jgi:tripartite ATP-independent transporter DctM subunit